MKNDFDIHESSAEHLCTRIRQFRKVPENIRKTGAKTVGLPNLIFYFNSLDLMLVLDDFGKDEIAETDPTKIAQKI